VQSLPRRWPLKSAETNNRSAVRVETFEQPNTINNHPTSIKLTQMTHKSMTSMEFKFPREKLQDGCEKRNRKAGRWVR